MRIRRIHFNNFGIIRNQTMEEIHPGLVIIAGPNRAGKTTFMLSLRHLGYGLPQKNIPAPITGQHDYSADIELADKRRGSIHILGLSKPKVTPFEGHAPMSTEEIFHSVDRFTYGQVFTISLDELRRIPEGISSKEEEHLQIVLLGGGWTDALRLAQFKREFDKKARDIGGSRGAKNVGAFRVYSDELRKGASKRDEANEQLDSYYSKQAELLELESETIPALESKLKQEDHQSKILEILKDHYKSYEKMLLLEEKLKDPANDKILRFYPEGGLELSERLKEEYVACLGEHERSRQNFFDAAGKEDPAPFLENKEALTGYEKELSGWREKVTGFRESKEAHLAEEENLKLKLESLNAGWADDLAVLKKMALDQINREALQKNAEEYKDAGTRLARISPEIKQAQERLAEKEKSRDAFEKAKAPKPISLPALAAIGLGLVLLTALAALIHPLSAVGAGLVIGGAVAAYFLFQKTKQEESARHLSSVETDLAHLEKQLLSLTAEAAALTENQERLRQKLDEAARSLELPEATPYNQLPHLYRDLMSLKENYDRWLLEKGKLKVRREELESIFSEISWVAGLLDQNVPEGDADFSEAETVFDGVENAANCLELARRLDKAAAEKSGLEEKIKALVENENLALEIGEQAGEKELSGVLGSFAGMGKIHKELCEERKAYRDTKFTLQGLLNMENRKALLLQDSPGEELFSVFHELFNRYASVKEIEQEQAQIERALKELSEEKEAHNKAKNNLESEIERLSTDEKLEEALSRVIGAKSKLESLAEQYAGHRLAEFLVDQMHKTFIEDTRGAVLDSAGEIFREMTSDQYREIALPEVEPGTGTTLDFAVLDSERAEPVPSRHLSRATKEQLFLSMRLSRIRSMQPLPVIFDDSLVNFDPAHSKQAARLIAGLSKTHQVFVLTCHHEFIKYLRDTAAPSQHWGLKEGRLLGPYPGPKEVLALLNP